MQERIVAALLVRSRNADPCHVVEGERKEATKTFLDRSYNAVVFFPSFIPVERRGKKLNASLSGPPCSTERASFYLRRFIGCRTRPTGCLPLLFRFVRRDTKRTDRSQNTVRPFLPNPARDPRTLAPILFANRSRIHHHDDFISMHFHPVDSRSRTTDQFYYIDLQLSLRRTDNGFSILEIRRLTFYE